MKKMMTMMLMLAVLLLAISAPLMAQCTTWQTTTAAMSDDPNTAEAPE